MTDSSTQTIEAIFETREAADLAIEHLVQQHALPRADVFVQAGGDRNTSGLKASGGDVSRPDGTRSDAPLRGRIEVSADIRREDVSKIQSAFRDAGALDIRVH